MEPSIAEGWIRADRTGVGNPLVSKSNLFHIRGGTILTHSY